MSWCSPGSFLLFMMNIYYGSMTFSGWLNQLSVDKINRRNAYAIRV
ncbi:LngX2 of CS21, Uncharacterised function (plasmid) [Escherichia coli]|nr:LngX2 of CS21, Uncharacterised function [Escherichia coli]